MVGESRKTVRVCQFSTSAEFCVHANTHHVHYKCTSIPAPVHHSMQATIGLGQRTMAGMGQQAHLLIIDVNDHQRRISHNNLTQLFQGKVISVHRYTNALQKGFQYNQGQCTEG